MRIEFVIDAVLENANGDSVVEYYYIVEDRYNSPNAFAVNGSRYVVIAWVGKNDGTRDNWQPWRRLPQGYHFAARNLPLPGRTITIRDDFGGTATVPLVALEDMTNSIA